VTQNRIRLLIYGLLIFGLVLQLSVTTLAAQDKNEPPASTMVSKPASAIGYQVGAGGTKVDLKATDLMRQASGEAKVELKSTRSSANIEVTARGLAPASQLGAEFLTYVLWIVTPDGRTGNSGEILIDKEGYSKMKVTTPAQTFSLIITAEPYFAVRMPSEMVVLQSEIRKDTKGRIFPPSEYKLMKRAQYQKLGNPLALTPDVERTPLEVYEARNAVDIAKANNAEKYAADIFAKAKGGLEMVEGYVASKAERGKIVSFARNAIQFAEDARALSVQRQEEERIEKERLAAAALAKSEAEAKAAKEAEIAKREADARAAEIKRKADEEAKRQAELAAAKEEVLKVREEAAKAAAEKERREKEQLRAQLLEQFNSILETRDTPRGLVVNMGDVLFDTGKYNLKSNARELLAKLSGIVLGHPGLMLNVEGHTDNVGGDDLNQKLSEDRAKTVREYLVLQNLPATNVTAIGFGKTQPVADNGTPAGRQKNRRVEIVVSGEVRGQKIGSS